MKKLLFILFILFNINVFSQTREFGKTYGDEPWKTFDKKNVGGKLITVGWGISVITFLSVNQPKPIHKIISYGVGPTFVLSGVGYWIVKGKQHKKRNEYLLLNKY
jgi:hypothetical protein